MPFPGTVTMEYCDTATDDVGKDAVMEAARRTPRDVDDWFLTLTRANEKTMCAWKERRKKSFLQKIFD